MTARQYVDRKTGNSCHGQCSAGARPQPPAGPPLRPRRLVSVPPLTNIPVWAIRESPWGVVMPRHPPAACVIDTKMTLRGFDSASESHESPSSSFRRKPESRGRRGWHKWHPNRSNNLPTFSYLGVPAAAGMSDCYESMYRTPIRDRPLQQPLIGHSRHPLVILAPQFVIPAPQSSFQRKLESRRGGEG